MSTNHAHAFGITPGHADPEGRAIDYDLLDQFVGAAVDGCTPCQDAHLTLLVDDAPTAARMVELACVATHQQFGGLPSAMTHDGPGPNLEFRRLARVGVDGARVAMFDTCAAMTPAERRAAVNSATDYLIGYFMLS